MNANQLNARQTLALAISESRGAWRRLVFFVLCISIGVGAVMTIHSFTRLLNDSVKAESKGLLAADLAIVSSWEQTREDLEFLRTTLPKQSDFVFVKELHAMARFPNPKNPSAEKKISLLVEVKSVPARAPFYPLYGRLKLSPEKPLNELLSDSGAVVAPAFLVKTGLNVGDSFDLGDAVVRILGTVSAEPDQISRAFSIGPRIFISQDTLVAAKLIRFGSRVKHKTLIGIPDSLDVQKTKQTLEAGLKDESLRVKTYKNTQSSITQNIAQMSRYLGAVGIIALLLGGIGVAMIVRTFMAQKLDTIAILNCMGAAPRTLFKVYLLQAVLLGLLGSLLGIFLGYALQYTLPPKVAGLLNVSVEPVFYWRTAIKAVILGMTTTLLFCLWPLIRAVKTKPLRLFRRNFGEEELSKGSRRERWIAGIALTAGLALLIFWQAGSLLHGGIFILALGVSTLLLRAVSALSLKGLKKLPPPRSMTRRYGLANLYRPNNQAVSIITCLGLGIMLVLSVRLVQMDMLAMLKSNTENRPPNLFFIDIQADQAERFKAILDELAPAAERTLTPLIRSRFSEIDGRKADGWVYKNPRREKWFITRSFVLTHMTGPPPQDNEIIAGEWWTPEEASSAQVSLEEDAAERLQAKIGSKLTMDIQGAPITATVTSVRRVKWKNMRTNFYMIFTPGALEGAPMTFVSTLYLPEDKENTVHHAVVNEFPNITALSTRDIIETIESVVSKLMTLVDFMSAFCIAAGLFILSGSIASTKFRRLKESAILKILGARRDRVAGILGIEYMTLGLVAGLMGIGLSMALSWAVMEYLVKASWNLYPGVMAWTLILGVLLTTLTGILSSLDVLKNKPLATLRKIDA